MSSRPKHLFRIASLVLPSWLAWYVACSAPHRDELARAMSFALGPLWIAIACILLVRALIMIGTHRRGGTSPILQEIDILSSTGTALAWTSSLAIIAAMVLGYASLAVVGVLGTGVFHLAAFYAFLALRSREPMRPSAIRRRFSPEALVEGDEAIEEITVDGARIPLGYRLFLNGHVGPRWAASRHVLESTASGAEVVLESDVGPAIRGEHETEPLVVWLEDVFGLTRSRRLAIGQTKLVVLPRMRSVDQAAPLRDHGQGPRETKRTRRLPTEGAFDLREYREGDDVRRIHWVRSLATNQLVVRMPDELPPDRPRVRVVLDTFFPEVFAMSSDTPGEVLDVLVGVWLAVARSLAESGSRVTLVTAVPRGEDIETLSQEMTLRTPHLVQRLGARAAWQNRMPVESLLTNEATYVISRAVLTPPPKDPKFRWVLVSPPVPRDLSLPLPGSARLMHPMGSSENRSSHRRRVKDRFLRARADHTRTMLAVGQRAMPPPTGSFIAEATAGDRIHLEAIR